MGVKSDRGFSYDPDAVEAAENGTLKEEAELTLDSKLELPGDREAVEDAANGGVVTGDNGQEGVLDEEGKAALDDLLANANKTEDGVKGAEGNIGDEGVNLGDPADVEMVARHWIERGNWDNAIEPIKAKIAELLAADAEPVKERVLKYNMTHDGNLDTVDEATEEEAAVAREAGLLIEHKLKGSKEGQSEWFFKVYAPAPPAPKPTGPQYGSRVLLRELRSRDSSKKRTCAACLTRVPLAQIESGKGEVCDTCKNK